MSERITISISDDLAQYIDQTTNNRSAYIRELIQADREIQEDRRVRELRVEEQKAELEALERKIEIKQEIIEELQPQSENDIIAEAAKAFPSETDARRHPDAAETWADRAGMTIEEFYQALQEYHRNGGDD